MTDAINAAGVRILFIGLNTPKQDYRMAAHKGRVPAVMVGFGAAFDFPAGTDRQAPRRMMPPGLERLFRLATEPRPPMETVPETHPRYVVLLTLQLLGWAHRK